MDRELEKYRWEEESAMCTRLHRKKPKLKHKKGLSVKYELFTH